MRQTRGLVICMLALFATVAPAHAATLFSSPPAGNAEVKPNNLYAVEVRCKSNKQLEDPSARGYSRSLFLLVTKSLPTRRADGSSTVPSDALAAMEFYFIGLDKATGQKIRDDFRDQCGHYDYLLNGPKTHLFLVLTQNELHDFASSDVAKLPGLLGSITPIFSLILGNPLPVLVSGAITAIQAVIPGIAAVLNTDKGFNQTDAIELNRVGTYKANTKYVVITVNVRPMDSIVLDQNDSYKDDLKKQINGATAKLDGDKDKMAQSCHGALYDISQLGLKSPTDLAYGLLHMSAHAGFGQTQSILCLTNQYAYFAAKADSQKFWVSFPAGFSFTEADVDKIYKPDASRQPPWGPETKRKIDDLVVALARYFRNTPSPQDSIDTLDNLLAASLAVVDRTTSDALGTDGKAAERFAAIQPFQQKGFIRVGCYAATTDATDQDLDGATSMFLVFQQPDEGKKSTIEAALAVRPLFGPNAGPIDKLIVSDNRKWVTAVLADRGYDCNGFSVEKPAVPKTQ